MCLAFKALGRSKSTLNWHARRLHGAGRGYAGGAFIVRALGYSGVRNGNQFALWQADAAAEPLSLDPALSQFHPGSDQG